MCHLSANFSLNEFTRSQTAARLGIPMEVPVDGQIFGALTRLCTQLLQPLRNILGRSVYVTSGYRPPILNRKIGGSRKSQHIKGEAADIVVTGVKPLEVCQAVVHLGLPFDQLIHEFGRWTHISVAPEYRAPRAGVLTAWRNLASGRTEYLTGLSSMEEIENSRMIDTD